MSDQDDDFGGGLLGDASLTGSGDISGALPQGDSWDNGAAFAGGAQFLPFTMQVPMLDGSTGTVTIDPSLADFTFGAHNDALAAANAGRFQVPAAGQMAGATPAADVSETMIATGQNTPLQPAAPTAGAILVADHPSQSSPASSSLAADDIDPDQIEMVTGDPYAQAAGKVMGLIKLKESFGDADGNGADYNAVAHMPKGQSGIDFSKMTVGDVLDWQADHPHAVGAYQLEPDRLRSLASETGMMDEPFNAQTQDAMARQLLRDKGFDDYMSGQADKPGLMDRLSKTWVSLKPISGKVSDTLDAAKELVPERPTPSP